MKYEMLIGKVYDISSQSIVPKRRILISEDQRNILVLFSNKRLNKLGYSIYNINGCEFEIQLSFDDKPYFKQKVELENEV